MSALICYIYREKEKNETSIELVFDTVASEIEKYGNTVFKWYKPLSWRRTFREIRQLRRQKFDLYHITGDINYLWIFFPWNKTTMTVHDIGMYKNHPKSIKRRLFVFFSFILPAIILKKITCVSELTRRDLINILGISPHKIEVIDNPLVLDIDYSPKEFDEECPRILQIGTGPHKNLESLIEAVKGYSCRLEIVGSPSQLLIDRMNLSGIKYHISGRLSNDEMIEKYRQCDILYFVSRSEGFGLPILEAQSMGRPVLTADTEPTRTVCGGGALMFSPDDISGIREGIIKIATQSTERKRLIELGLANIKRYDRTAIASMYSKYYRDCYGI